MLYGPAGYYFEAGIAKSGKAGDYFTAPDVGPGFWTELLAGANLFWLNPGRINYRSTSIAHR